MKKIQTIFRWLLVGLVGLLLTAPASVAGWLLVDTPFSLIAIHGSLWQGGGWLSGRGLNGIATPIAPIFWSLSWKNGPVFVLRTSDGAGTLRPGVGGFELVMPAFVVDISSLPLTASGHSLSGRLRGFGGGFECTYRRDCRGTARLRIEGGALGEISSDQQGNIDIAPLASEGGQLGRLIPDGATALNGELTLSRNNGRMAINGTLQPTSLASMSSVGNVRYLGSAATESPSFRKY